MSKIDFDNLRLSASVAKPIVDYENTFRGWVKHRQSPYEFKASDTMIRGKIIERLLLGENDGDEDGKLVVLNFDNFKGGEAQKAKKEVIASGDVPVLAIKMEEYSEAVDGYKDQLRERGITFDGEGENQKRLEWTDKNGVKCSGYTDRFDPKKIKTYEIKTISSASYDECLMTCFKMNYDLQCVSYDEGMASMYPVIEGKHHTDIIWLEYNAPYQVQVTSLSAAMREVGQQKWDYAKRMWGKAIKAKKFESFPLHDEVLDPLPWMLEKAERINRNWE